MSERRARERLVAVARRLDGKGILTATDGNLSLLLDDGSLLITPSGCCKGTMTEDDLVVVQSDGSARGGKPSSEIAMHRAIYDVRPDVQAIVHAHPPFATAHAVAGIALDEPILSEVVLTLGEVPVAPYSLPTAQGLADAVAPFARRGRAVLMRFHGAVVFGDSIENAGQLMETLEHVAKIDTIRRALDSTAKLDEKDASELRALRAKLFGW